MLSLIIDTRKTLFDKISVEHKYDKQSQFSQSVAEWNMKWLVILSLLSLSTGKWHHGVKEIIFINHTTVYLASPVPDEQYPDYRWTMIPDTAGRMHLVDLNSFEEPIEPNYVAETDAFFTLRTRANPAGERIQLENLASLQGSSFNGAHETRFTIHGWGGSGSSSFNTNVAREYHIRGEYNVSWNSIQLDSHKTSIFMQR